MGSRPRLEDLEGFALKLTGNEGEGLQTMIRLTDLGNGTLSTGEEGSSDDSSSEGFRLHSGRV